MKTFYLSFVILLILSSSVLSQERGMKRPEKLADQFSSEIVYRKGWAIAIGINDYPNLPSRYKLNYAVSDARDFVNLLKGRFGFEDSGIILLTDSKATKKNIMEKFYSFADPKLVSKDDCVIFYFSGHGQTVPLPRGGNIGFLIPYDANVDLSQEPNLSEYKMSCIGMNELYDTAKLIPAKHIIFIIDACYSGLVIESTRSLRADIPGYLDKVSKVNTQQIITAGMHGEEAQESSEVGHGIFTYKLLEGLGNSIADMNNDGIITGSELATYLSESVRSKTNGKQNPQWRKVDEGEFLFIPQITQKVDAEIKVQTLKTTLSITSEPNHADVYVDGQERGKTPCTIELDVGVKGEKEFVVSVAKDGYETAHAKVKLKLGESKIWSNVQLRRLEAVAPPPSTQPESAYVPPAWGMEIIGRDGAPMVLIPAGTFQMGSDNGDFDEKPAHLVFLDAFYIDVYEVTNAQYKKFMDETGHPAPAYWNYSEFNAPDQPVVGVSWDDAVAYCQWAGKRLPTEAEWEKAARAGTTSSKYPWGNDVTHDNANFFGTGGRDTWHSVAPVGKFEPNRYGLYDIIGNVWEWCSDWYESNYYSSSPDKNPKGPASGIGRVLRGGAWNVGQEYLSVSKRYSREPAHKYSDLGFRCVIDAKR